MSKADIKAELDALAAQHNGLLRAEDVVAFAAANPASACHSWFTWDDEQAAHQHRLNQARALIRVHVRYEQLEHPAYSVRIREYVSLSSDRVNGGGYRSMDDVLRNTDLAAELLADALREFERMRRKYAQLTELRNVFAAVDEISAKAG